MRNHVIAIVSLVLMAPFSRADSCSPEEAVKLLIHSPHGVSGLASKELRDTWEEMKRNPKPYLPALKAQITMQRIEATTDNEQLRGILNAINYLVLLGGDEGRNMLVARLKELQQKRDVLSPELKARGRRLSSSTTPPSEWESFKANVKGLKRLLSVESTILDGFAQAGDLRLRDTVLPRLDDDKDMRDRYIEYFEATGRKDPVVRARLKKMLEAPASPSTRQSLKHFFEEQ
ncbi:hypothetical protein ACN28E_24360 [Archangium lansingense]|uniref:hypothetical protein n=1 Tax=Archangium lansingense TaxID=2995310 RepID=UPI003B7C800E